MPRIITADCPFPKEIDDGLFVERMDEDHELYRVGVCVVDTSSVYDEPSVLEQAYTRTTAKYWDIPGDEPGYEPMIDPSIIKGLEFTAGSVRDALIVTFLVGAKKEPSDVSVSFGEVEVAHNMSYKDFAYYTSYRRGKKFANASRLIKDHLGYAAYGDHAGTRPQWQEGQSLNTLGRAKRGSKMNEAFMVATNHLVGQMLANEDRQGLDIFRIHDPKHDPEDEQYIEFLPANVARFSTVPGLHAGLGLDPYCRVTSPLRRLDDFVMNYQLKQRFLGVQPTAQDAGSVTLAVERLTQELIASAPGAASRFNRQSVLGRAATGQVLPIAVGQ